MERDNYIGQFSCLLSSSSPSSSVIFEFKERWFGGRFEPGILLSEAHNH